MAPWGDLIVCEDTASHCGLVGVRADGSQYHLVVRDTDIVDNGEYAKRATLSDSRHGAGAYLEGNRDSRLYFYNCVIARNVNERNGGGIFKPDGTELKVVTAAAPTVVYGGLPLVAPSDAGDNA